MKTRKCNPGLDLLEIWQFSHFSPKCAGTPVVSHLAWLPRTLLVNRIQPTRGWASSGQRLMKVEDCVLLKSWKTWANPHDNYCPAEVTRRESELWATWLAPGTPTDRAEGPRLRSQAWGALTKEPLYFQPFVSVSHRFVCLFVFWK